MYPKVFYAKGLGSSLNAALRPQIPSPYYGQGAQDAQLDFTQLLSSGLGIFFPPQLCYLLAFPPVYLLSLWAADLVEIPVVFSRTISIESFS